MLRAPTLQNEVWAAANRSVVDLHLNNDTQLARVAASERRSPMVSVGFHFSSAAAKGTSETLGFPDKVLISATVIVRRTMHGRYQSQVPNSQNLPRVQTCANCNNKNSRTEHYLTTVMPFGSQHTLDPARTVDSFFGTSSKWGIRINVSPSKLFLI